MFAFIFVITIAISINFSQSFYVNDEKTKVVQPMILLTNPSSTDIAVQVGCINITAFGRHYQLPIGIP